MRKNTIMVWIILIVALGVVLFVRNSNQKQQNQQNDARPQVTVKTNDRVAGDPTIKQTTQAPDGSIYVKNQYTNGQRVHVTNQQIAVARQELTAHKLPGKAYQKYEIALMLVKAQRIHRSFIDVAKGIAD